MSTLGKLWIVYDRKSKKQTKPLSLEDAQSLVLGLLRKGPQRFLIWTPGFEDWIPLQKFLDSDQEYFLIPPRVQTVTMTRTQHESVQTKAPDFDDEKTFITDNDPESAKIPTILEASTIRKLETDSEEWMFTSIDDSDSNNDEDKPDYGYFATEVSGDDLRAPRVKSSLQIKIADEDPATVQKKRAARKDYQLEITLLAKNGKAFKSTSRNISLSGTLLEDPIPKDFLHTQFDLIIINKFEKDSRRSRINFKGKVVGDFADPRRLSFMSVDAHSKEQLKTLFKSYSKQKVDVRKKKAS